MKFTLLTSVVCAWFTAAGWGADFTGVVMGGLRPVPDVAVRPIDLTGRALSHAPLRTNSRGRFFWDGGPEVETLFVFSKPGYETLQRTLSPSTRFPIVDLTRIYEFTGLVTDAATGKPVTNFFVLSGNVRAGSYGGHSPIFWRLMPEGRRLGGSFSLQYFSGFDQQQVLVGADGYVPMATPFFLPADVARHTFELIRGPSQITGVVYGPGGAPLIGAQVRLGAMVVREALLAHRPPRWGPPPGAAANGANRALASDALKLADLSDGTGRFRLSNFIASEKIVAMHPLGFALTEVGLVNLTHRIDLQPWGRVEGVLQQASQPLAHQPVELIPEGAELLRQLNPNDFRAVTDADGHFQFERAPSGPCELAAPANWAGFWLGGLRMSVRRRIVVKPLETTRVALELPIPRTEPAAERRPDIVSRYRNLRRADALAAAEAALRLRGGVVEKETAGRGLKANCGPNFVRISCKQSADDVLWLRVRAETRSGSADPDLATQIANEIAARLRRRRR